MTDASDNKLDIATKDQIEFACHVVRVMRHVLSRMQMEHRKNWKTDDILHLMDTVIYEIQHGITEEDKEREIIVARGKTSFKQGVLRDKNPYPAHDKHHEWWDTGWHDGERAHKRDQLITTTVSEDETQQVERTYRIQAYGEQGVKEWSEVLHMYVEANGGTVYQNYEEAELKARRLQADFEGMIKVITAESS